MKAAATVLAAMLLASGAATAGGVDADLDLTWGVVSLDEDEWRPVEDQSSFGFETTWGDRKWPVRIAADLHLSQDDQSFPGVEFEGRTLELAVGARRSFRTKRAFQPHVGLGVAAVDAEVEGSGFGQTATADDLGVGYWVEAGFRTRVVSGFRIGLSARWSDVEVSLPFVGGTVDGGAGGLRYGILLGWTLEKSEPWPIASTP